MAGFIDGEKGTVAFDLLSDDGRGGGSSGVAVIDIARCYDSLRHLAWCLDILREQGKLPGKLTTGSVRLSRLGSRTLPLPGMEETLAFEGQCPGETVVTAITLDGVVLVASVPTTYY